MVSQVELIEAKNFALLYKDVQQLIIELGYDETLTRKERAGIILEYLIENYPTSTILADGLSYLVR